jgi:hypothetical protein
LIAAYAPLGQLVLNHLGALGKTLSDFPKTRFVQSADSMPERIQDIIRESF